MSMPRYNFTREELYTKYHEEHKSAFDIAEEYGCDHKTIRSWMKKLDIPVKSAEEYNYQCRVEYTSPSEEQLFEPLSIAAHMIYLCEGWHTNKTTSLSFCNQDTQLIDMFLTCVMHTYQYKNVPPLSISYNFDCPISLEKAKEYENLYDNRKVRIQRHNDSQRKNPIMRIKVGGKRMSKEFVDNCYRITRELTKKPQ